MVDMNRIDANVTKYWEAMTEQNNNEQAEVLEQLQQLTTHNTVLAELIQAQQKKIDELLETSIRMVAAL